MVKREVVISRINKLNEYIDILKSARRYSKETYVSDPFIYGATDKTNCVHNLFTSPGEFSEGACDWSCLKALWSLLQREKYFILRRHEENSTIT